MVARIYFKSLFSKSFKRDDECFINAALNYGYAIVRSLIMNIIVSKDLHPSLGLWHHSQFNNFNLADDLIEVNRPMVDYLVYNLAQTNTEFTKQVRMKLQELLLQNIAIDGVSNNLKYLITIYVDSIINALNDKDIKQLKLPCLVIDNYEY